MKRTGVKLSTQATCSKLTTKPNSTQVKCEESQSDHCNSSTPTHSNRLLPSLVGSPILSQATLEDENLEVTWDWNSPQSKYRRKQKKMGVKNSPKLLIKKYPSNNQIPEFDKLNQELKNLTDLTVENVETMDNNLDSVFNDSMEAELLVCSQKIESELLENELPSKVVELPVGMKTPKRICNSEIPQSCSSEIPQTFSSVQSVNNLCSIESNGVNYNIAVKSITIMKAETPNKIADDSFDMALQALGDEDMDFSFINNKKLKTSPNSLDIKEITNSIPTSSTTQCTLEEIENKRKQALEKLQKKKPASCETSPLKCSQEEIEKKRLQAKAKLEAKKKQDLIEKNRREALRRLEINKKRRALQFSVSVQPVKLSIPKK